MYLLALYVTVHDSSLVTWLQELRVHMARLLCASMSHYQGKKPTDALGACVFAQACKTLLHLWGSQADKRFGGDG